MSIVSVLFSKIVRGVAKGRRSGPDSSCSYQRRGHSAVVVVVVATKADGRTGRELLNAMLIVAIKKRPQGSYQPPGHK